MRPLYFPDDLAPDTIATSIDRTHPGLYCPVHGDHAPAAYLGRERYGCWHCNPTRPAGAADRAPKLVGPPVEYETERSEIPAWMLGDES